VIRIPAQLKLCTVLLALLAWGTGAALATEAETLLEHELSALDGDPVRLEEFRGRVVVVNFWASWCKPCQRELPELDRWDTELPDDQVVFAAISVDRQRRRAERFASRAGLSLPFYHDGADGLARSLDLPALPCTYVLDASGEVAAISQGSSAEDLARLRTTIDGLLEDAAVAAQQEAAR
jgi:thiol-disulfide isomerase/thioredoxin